MGRGKVRERNEWQVLCSRRRVASLGPFLGGWGRGRVAGCLLLLNRENFARGVTQLPSFSFQKNRERGVRHFGGHHHNKQPERGRLRTRLHRQGGVSRPGARARVRRQLIGAMGDDAERAPRRRRSSRTSRDARAMCDQGGLAFIPDQIRDRDRGTARSEKGARYRTGNYEHEAAWWANRDTRVRRPSWVTAAKFKKTPRARVRFRVRLQRARRVHRRPRAQASDHIHAHHKEFYLDDKNGKTYAKGNAAKYHSYLAKWHPDATSGVRVVGPECRDGPERERRAREPEDSDETTPPFAPRRDVGPSHQLSSRLERGVSGGMREVCKRASDADLSHFTACRVFALEQPPPRNRPSRTRPFPPHRRPPA